MQPRRFGSRGCEGSVEIIDLLEKRGKVVSWRCGESAEAHAVTARDAVQGAGGCRGVVTMCRMRDRVQAERQHQTDEQSSWPMA